MIHPITVQFATDAANQAGYLSIANLPALTGSEKQISWANNIRRQIAKEFVELICKANKITMGPVLRSDVDHYAKVEAKIAENFETQKGGAQIVAAIDKIFSRADAKFWIDNRNAVPSQLIKASS